jgi:hypothetical protein
MDDILIGTLERLIDDTIKAEHRTTFSIFMAKEAGLDIKNELDYGLGHAHGVIRASFITSFIEIMRRLPDDYEMLEMNDVIFRRNADLKDAILNSGGKLSA